MEASHLESARAALHVLGYEAETDWLPVLVEVTAPGRGRVDLHPVVFDTDGHGVQAGPDGTTFEYPADCFARGHIDGTRVECLSVARRLATHAGYEPRAVDRHDVAVLRQFDAGARR